MAFEKRDFQRAETCLLRAQRPELAARYYKVHELCWVAYLNLCNVSFIHNDGINHAFGAF